ncbi:MAG TPA: HIT family protein [Patescibacteria group bacterium]
MDCIFCKIVKDKSSSHKIWEDEKHLAFLSIFPNTEAFTVVITKQHYPSDFYTLPSEIFSELTLAARKVGELLNSKLDDVGRTGLIYEGFGVDHVHVKLFPMHGTKMDAWKAIKSNVDKYFEKYEGYISSHDYKRTDDSTLALLAKKITD